MTLLARSLSGIPLEWSPSPPPGLPKYPGAFYFKIDHTHAYWSDVQRNLNFCLYWDGAPEDTKAEVVVLRK
jgi:predicted component of type VI protein secretion system